MAVSFFIHREAGRFPAVMEQHRTAQDRVRRHRLQGVEGVLPDIITVVPVPLVEAHHRQQFRPEHADHIHILPQNLRRPYAAQQLEELHLNPLSGDVPQEFPVVVDARPCGRVNGKAQYRCEPQSPQNAQGILLKAAVRVTHAAQDAPLQVLPSAEGVPQLSPEVQRHGVDREVPPRQVLLQRAGEGDVLRPPVVVVFAVHPVGGDLHRLVLHADRHRTVL